MTDTITISKDEYEKLKADAERLEFYFNRTSILYLAYNFDSWRKYLDEVRKHHE
jgi:hypothetical protein